MPAFTFEKISPPIPPGPVSPTEKTVSPIEKKPRGVIVQIVGRLVEKRVERAQRAEQSSIARREQREPK
jgi:hypothetical protein